MNHLATEQRRLLQPLWNHLERTFAPYQNATICLAISGGPDSRALLESVARWKNRFNFNWLVATVDHGVRPESALEAQAVADRARAIGFDSVILSGKAVKTDEASLRDLRYGLLWQAAKERQISVICTAHHQDDDAESFLMHIFGLGGRAKGASMGQESIWPNGVILRPFLDLSRLHLMSTLTALNQTDYFLDPTNQGGQSSRSLVRNFLAKDAYRFHANPAERLSNLAKMVG